MRRDVDGSASWCRGVDVPCIIHRYVRRKRWLANGAHASNLFALQCKQMVVSDEGNDRRESPGCIVELMSADRVWLQ